MRLGLLALLAISDCTCRSATVRGVAPRPGAIRVWRRAVDGSTDSCSGRVDVVPFELYVQRVLPHEWMASWEPEALKAGAVAARSFAAHWIRAGGKYPCADVDDTTASQVYDETTAPETDDAVEATAGQIVVDPRGDVILAEYSAENGDPTADGIRDSTCAGMRVDGHGRGMCQWGTQRWAVQGKSYQWIVGHYYPTGRLTVTRF
jgi:peptidoglycan hydrolase-like amidase